MKLILIIAVIAAFGIGYYFIHNRENTPLATETSVSEDDEAVDEDTFTIDNETWKRVTDPDAGIEFAYRASPNGYRLETHDASEGDTSLFVRGYVLMLEEDFQSLQADLSANNTPREGPPTINVSIFKNDNNMFPAGWAEAYPQYSNISLALTEVGSVPISGANAIRYRADGLYVSDTIIIVHGGYIYVVSGSFIDEDSTIRKDFEPFVRTISFVPTL